MNRCYVVINSNRLGRGLPKGQSCNVRCEKVVKAQRFYQVYDSHEERMRWISEETCKIFIKKA